MDIEIVLKPKVVVDGMSENVDTEMVPLDQMEMGIEEPVGVFGIEDEVGHLKESDTVFRDEKKKENEIEAVVNEEDVEEEKKNDANPKEEVTIEENNEEDQEEAVKNDENPKENASIKENNEDPEEEMSVEENDEEDPEEEVKNDENPKEEVKIVEGTRNETKNEGKLEAIWKNKVIKLRKRPETLKAKTMALRKKIKNALVIALRKKAKNVSTSKLDRDGRFGNGNTQMVPSDPIIMHGEASIISMPLKSNIVNDVGTESLTSEKNEIVDNVVTGAASSKPVKMNGEKSYVVLEVKNNPKESIVVSGVGKKKEHKISKVNNEENTKDEGKNGGDTRNEAKAKGKLEANLKKKINKLREKRNRKKNALRGNNEVVRNMENPESSEKKTTMKVKSTGMIFMCSSKTKKDCYHYHVLGFPASKRDLVLEIYEGTKLFLFDYDLKLMYGIYEAAGPGGYNIEPKAFNSAFPSQVRFKVLEDCLPLAEEKFRKIIKDNYYSKNKFHCQLSAIQVNNLCKLFRVASKGSTSKQFHRSQRAEAPALAYREPKQHRRSTKTESPRVKAPTLVDRGSKRPRKNRKAENPQAEAPTLERESKRPRRNRKAEGPRAEAPTFVDGQPKRSRRSKKSETCTFVDRKPKRFHRVETETFLYRDSRHNRWEGERHHTFARDQLYSEDPMAYRREIYEPPMEHLPLRQPLHLPLASARLPISESAVYRRDELERGDLRPLDLELRRRDEFEHHDSYMISRHQEEFQDRGSHLTSRGHLSYHYPSSSAGQPPDYRPLAFRRPASNYHLSASSRPDYQTDRPVYRYQT